MVSEGLADQCSKTFSSRPSQIWTQKGSKSAPAVQVIIYKIPLCSKHTAYQIVWYQAGYNHWRWVQIQSSIVPFNPELKILPKRQLNPSNPKHSWTHISLIIDFFIFFFFKFSITHCLYGLVKKWWNKMCLRFWLRE